MYIVHTRMQSSFTYKYNNTEPMSLLFVDFLVNIIARTVAVYGLIKELKVEVLLYT